jgi:hypothetical protein
MTAKFKPKFYLLLQANCLFMLMLQVRLQTQNFRNPQYKGAVDCFASILKKESV